MTWPRVQGSLHLTFLPYSNQKLSRVTRRGVPENDMRNVSLQWWLNIVR